MTGLVKLLSSADVLMNTALQCTALTVIIHREAEPNRHSYLIFFHYLNVCSPDSDLIF